MKQNDVSPSSVGGTRVPPSEGNEALKRRTIMAKRMSEKATVVSVPKKIEDVQSGVGLEYGFDTRVFRGPGHRDRAKAYIEGLADANGVVVIVGTVRELKVARKAKF